MQEKKDKFMAKKKIQNEHNMAYKFRIYPNEEQKIIFAKTFGCTRKVWNLMLADKINYYKQNKTMLNVTPASYKKTYPYLKEIDSLALTNVQLNLEEAYKQFFAKKRKFPKFKSKKTAKKSFTTNVVNGNITFDGSFLKLPKIKDKVRVLAHREIPSDYVLKSVTISQTPDGEYYASLKYSYIEEYNTISIINEDKVIGLDYASHGLYVDSNGNFADMPTYYRNSQKRLAKEQRRLSKKQKDSNNYNKQKIKVAKIHRHTANQRQDFLHKKAKEITNLYDFVCVEDLNMQSIAKSLKLGKSTMDNGFGMFRVFLSQKLEKKGGKLVKIDKFYPSSQLCHHCGYKNPITKDLNIREYECPNCHAHLNRDLNAAINIKQEGIRILNFVI